MTTSPLEFKVLKAGDGVHKPKNGQAVRIHYVAKLKDDKSIIDSSRDRGKTFEFKLGENQVILGLEEIVPQLSVGTVCTVEIPHDMAYGEHGYPPIIPPRAILVYEIELLSFF